ncbi:hypothetical protein AALO_G00245240 [Alosa alosa]|uniref:Uncharacterized protein n=1 Tax=Alosa alosa TaxID=278164 RepID=A0AAV6FTB3_9TELE|nr:hypothetical protein AALO_G00245240 [Alosa alosa]
MLSRIPPLRISMMLKIEAPIQKCQRYQLITVLEMSTSPQLTEREKPPQIHNLNNVGLPTLLALRKLWTQMQLQVWDSIMRAVRYWQNRPSAEGWNLGPS